jgi:hypothetical protein
VEALERLEAAVEAGDGVRLFRCLDQVTRWAIESTWRDQRNMRTIIAAKYPEPEARQALGRIEAAAETDVARYFAASARERQLLERLRARLGPAATAATSRELAGKDAVVLARPGRPPLRFARGRDGSWGFADLEGEWGREQERAVHALATVRENAALYQSAQGRP